MIIIPKSYASLVTILALRQYSLSKIREALKCYGDGNVVKGKSEEDSANVATKIADEMCSENK